jgi:hypothetical protein
MFRNREAGASVISLRSRVLWLACGVQFQITVRFRVHSYGHSCDDFVQISTECFFGNVLLLQQSVVRIFGRSSNDLAKPVNETVPNRHHHRTRATAAVEASRFSLFGRIAIYAFHQEIFQFEAEQNANSNFVALRAAGVNTP